MLEKSRWKLGDKEANICLLNKWAQNPQRHYQHQMVTYGPYLSPYN